MGSYFKNHEIHENLSFRLYYTHNAKFSSACMLFIYVLYITQEQTVLFLLLVMYMYYHACTYAIKITLHILEN